MAGTSPATTEDGRGRGGAARDSHSPSSAKTGKQSSPARFALPRMDQIAAIVLPVFGLVGVGYGVAWSKLLGTDNAEALSEFLFVIAIGFLVFRVVATADFAGISAWRLWLPFFSGFALSWAAGTLVIPSFFGRHPRAGLVV